MREAALSWSRSRLRVLRTRRLRRRRYAKIRCVAQQQLGKRRCGWHHCLVAVATPTRLRATGDAISGGQSLRKAGDVTAPRQSPWSASLSACILGVAVTPMAYAAMGAWRAFPFRYGATLFGPGLVAGGLLMWRYLAKPREPASRKSRGTHTFRWDCPGDGTGRRQIEWTGSLRVSNSRHSFPFAHVQVCCPLSASYRRAVVGQNGDGAGPR